MKALIVTKKLSHWLFAIGCWLLLPITAHSEKIPDYCWSAPEECLVCDITCPANMSVSTDPGLCTAVVNYTVTITDPATCSSSLIRTAGLSPGSAFPLGVTLNAFEINGPAGLQTCSFTVTVNDTENPVITGCPANIAVNNTFNECEAPATWTPPTANDNCAVATFTHTHPPGSVFVVGITAVSYTATDNAGLTAVCTFNVTVSDTESPFITDCPANIATNSDPGFCSAIVNWTPPTALDNCGMLILNASHLPGATFPSGTTTVTYTATDNTGLMAVCTFDVSVTETEPPQISSCLDPACTGTQPGCPFPVFINNDPGLCTAVAVWDPVLGADNCPGIVTLTSTHNSGDVFPSGFTTVTYTATDAAGNISTCNFDVFVDDAEPPLLTCPDITVNTDPGVCEAVVIINPAASDNCGIASVTIFPASGSVFPLGTTNIDVIAVDNTGIPAFCNFNLTVEDNEAPTIANCPANISVNNDLNFCSAFVNWTQPTANDNCTFTNLTESHSPGNFFPVGTTTVTYTAADFFGNTSTCTFDVTVVDNEAPILTFCPADITVATDFGTCDASVTWTPPSVFDNCFTTTLSSTHNSGDVFNLGTTAVTYTATDAVGNMSTCIFNVTVQDFQAPLITGCPADITTNVDPGNCSAIINWVPPTALDNCGIASFTSGNNPGDLFPTGGTFTVIYTATDNAGLVANCFFDVTVLDNEAPAMTGCPADINVTTSITFGICAGIVSWTNPNFTDNCGIGLSGSSHINGGYFPLGTTTLNIFASDFSGNNTICTFNITLVDDEPPSYIPCPSNYLVDTDPGVCTAVVNYPVFTIFENCGLASTTNSHNPSDAFPVGTTTVTYTATDNAGLTGSCIFNVIVNDAEPPTISACPANITMSSEFNNCVATAAWVSPTASDNCGGTTLTSTHLPGTVFPVGTTTVTYTATDNGGLTAVCSFDVVVEDIFAPVITGCPSNVTVNADPGLCTAIINWTIPAATDNCGIASFTSTHTPGSAYFGGITTVFYNATDINGLSSTCFFIITIVDTEPPVISGCPADISVNNDPGVCSVLVNWVPPTVTDNCAGATLFSFYTPPSIFYLGTTTVNYAATDLFGMTATCSFTVTVSDVEPPIFVDCPSDINLNTEPGTCSASATWVAPTVNDNCGGITITNSHVPGATFSSGTTTVTYTTTDFGGLTAVCTFNVTVTDAESPVITGCPANIAANADPGVCSAVVNWTAPTASDNCGVATFTSSHLPGATFPLGTTAVAYTATDNAGLTAVCAFNVTVTDAESPVIIGCLANIAANADPGLCTAIINWTIPAATDNCGIASFTSTHTPGSAYFGGITTVFYNATDINGLSSTCFFIITIVDTEPPVISGCPADISVNNDPGVCSVLVNWVPPTVTDNCAGATLFSFYTPPSIFYLGTTTVNYAATDLYRNQTATCSFTVTVSDVEPPIFVDCPSDINLNTEPGTCSASATWVAPTVNDNCGGITITNSHVPGATFSSGTTTVTYTTTDFGGLTAVCTFNVTVTDAESPVITGCPANIAANADPGVCSAVVNWTAPTASDNCGVATFTSSHLPGATFPLGTTAVAYTATDNAGLTAVCAFNVTVTDAESPVIIGCLANIAANADPGVCSAAVNWTAPTASDNCGIATFTSSHLPGATFPLGTTAVAYTATDNAGLTAVCAFNVSVSDNQNPVITGCPANIAANADPGVCSAVVNWTAPTASDNCGIATFTSSHLPGATFPLGTTAVAYTATDNAGLTAVCAFNVSVSDNQNPVITGCPANIAANADPGVCSAVVNWTAPTASDNCGIATFTSSHLPGATFPLGTTAVAYTATDNAGLTAVCAFNVSVSDNQNPVITGCPANIAANADPGVCSAVVNWTAPTASDNCGVATFTSSHLPGATFPLGTTAVAYTATDNAGLTAVCAFNVSVSDNQNPVITGCPANIAANADPGVCSAVVNWTAPTASDNCGVATFTSSHLPGATFPLGTTAVAYTATDNAGLTAVCAFNVTVTDAQPPVITGCPANISSPVNTNTCDATVTWLLPSAADNCSLGSFSATNAPGSVFTVGVTTVTYTAADNAGNTSQCSFTVTVLDGAVSTNLVESICLGQSFSVGGVTFSTSGNFQVILTAVNGCDSTVNLALTVLPTFITNLTEQICQGETFSVGGQNFNSSGNFQVVLTAVNGCDSTVNLALTVLPTFTTSLTEQICQGETFSVGGVTFSISGNFQVILTAVNGCDSTVNLALTVLPTFITNLTEQICQGETFSVGGVTFSISGNFQVVLTAVNGCDSTVNLALTVLPTFTTSLTEQICQGETFSVGGQNFNSSGNFQVILTAVNGCDSTVNLALTVLPTFTTSLTEQICQGETFSVGGVTFSTSGNFQVILTAVNGCDSTVNLALTVLPTFTTSLTEQICQGETFSVGGVTFSTSGNFQVILTAVNGCDSTVNLALTVLPTFTTSLTEQICQGETFSVGGVTFSTSGNFQVILTAVNGCDSTVNLALTVLPTFITNLTEQICQGETFSVGGVTFSISGNFQVILTAVNGCDSTVNLALTVLPTFTTSLTEQICQGETFTVGGQNFNSSGNFQVVLTAVNGCDSTVNLALTVLPTFTTSLTEQICQGETFSVGGVTFSTSGNFQVILTAVNGCDSTVNLALTVLPTFTTSLTEQICQGETFTVGGQNFNSSGNFQVVLTAVNGCDSTVNLALTVLPTFTTSLTEQICQGETFTVGGVTFSISGNFQVILTAVNGCDSTVNLALTVLPTFTTSLTEQICQGETFSVGGVTFSISGNFQVILTAVNGCDSTVNLALTVLPTFTTSLTEQICQGETFSVGGVTFSTSGNFQVILTAVNGCDSTVNLALTVLPTFITNLTEQICQGETFSVGNQSFSQTGNYSVTLTAAGGCDSTVNLNLNVLPELTTNLTEAICTGETFTIGNQSFSQTGNYSVTLTAAGGCDSVVHLALTILSALQSTQSVALCEGDSIFLAGAFQASAGTYFDTLAALGGCDSILQTTLTIFQNPNAMIMGPNSVCLGLSILLSAGAFDAYAWSPGGETTPEIEVTAGGSYAVTVTDGNGCTASASTGIAEEICSVVNAAFFIGQDTACAMHFVQFSNQSGSNASEFLWNFGNGSFSTEANPYTIYPTPGIYIVTLIAGDGLAADTAVQQVFVYPKIEAAFSSLVSEDCAPKSLTFNDISSSTFGLTGWSWNFGDGTYGSGTTAQHTYSHFDTVNVTHVIVDQFGCTDSINQDVMVADLGATPPTVHLCLNLCEGDSLVVGSSVFNAQHPLGSATLTSASGCDSTVTVELTFQPLEIFSLGENVTICENESTVLDAGAGTAFLWSNGATTSTTSVSQSGNFTVTIADGTGCPMVGNIVVSADTIPVETATAGADFGLCETVEITLLDAQTPLAATGFWTTFGAAAINNTANPGTAVSNLAIGENYFIWTLNNGACESFSADTVRVNVTAEATETALAGDDLSFCHNVTAVQLEGVLPLTAGVSGAWSQPEVQAMLGVQIVEPGNPNSPIGGFFPDNTYIFTWTLTNGVCGSYSIDNVLVSFSDNLLPMADAGADISLCGGTEALLDANLPPGASGEWTAAGGAASTVFIADPFDAATMLSDLLPGAAAFVWTLSSENCPAYSSDTVLVFQSEGLQANADVYFNLGQPLTSLDFLANDAVPSRENVTLTFLSTPLYGSLIANNDGSYDFIFGVDTTENVEFTYKICLKDCPDLCSQADVVILSKLPPTLPPPIEKPANVITPNGDGTAEFLRIPNFNDLPAPIEILVINRWGDLVFEEKNYQNDWNGKTFNGKHLSDGTYYYILKAAGSEVSGAVTIVR